MKRRSFLAGGAAATAGLAGCLDFGVLGGSPGATDDVVLDEPEQYEERRRARDEGYIGPIHADELPEVTLPDALDDRDLSTHEYVGERHVVLTFVFTRCPTHCIFLTSNLAGAQAESLEAGYADEVAFMPVTFDPEYDTPDVIEEYSQAQGADPTAGNWHFLRPEDNRHARDVVTGEFDIWYERNEDVDGEDIDHDHDGGAHDEDEMLFNHESVIIIANADGYVERGYTGTRIPNVAGVIDDLGTLRERW